MVDYNIAASLYHMAEQQPSSLAVACPHGMDASKQTHYDYLTYQQLLTATNRIASGLLQAGLEPGMRVAFMVKPGIEFYTLTFGLFRSGIIPILIDPGIGLKYLKQCLAEAKPHAFIGVPKAHIARSLCAWARDSIKLNITVGKRWWWGGLTVEHIKQLGSDDFIAETTPATQTAAIVFTSGSTGVPKGVVYQHQHFLAQIELLRDAYDIKPGEVDLPTFPLFGLFDPALGMTTIIPDMDATRPAMVDPKKIIDAIVKFSVTNMFGSPALLNRIGPYAIQNNIKFTSLKRIISAGAPVPNKVLELFEQILIGDTQIHTAYGATEALPVASIASKQILHETKLRSETGAGICIGKPLAQNNVKIITISDEPIVSWRDDLVLPINEIGEIVICGPTVTQQYFERPKENDHAKIFDPANNQFWHRMGDVGYLDEQERLWYCGRKSQRVILEHQTLHTTLCETIFNAHPLVYRCALIGIQVSGKTMPALCVEVQGNIKSIELKKLTDELLAIAKQYPATQAIARIFYNKKFPVDIRHNAKIEREKLARWAQRIVT